MALGNIGLAYSAGLLAVLAPCALPMLPSYVSFFVNNEEKQASFFSAIGFGTLTVAGFLTVFLAIGLLPSFALNSLASRVNLVAPFIGAILVILGLGHLFTDIFYKIPILRTATPEGRGIKAFYLYGVGYGAASMACSFPVFVLLVLQSATVGGLATILVMFLAYGLGAATVIIPLTLALTYSRELFYERLMTLLPHMKKINALILIAAGVYMIYYSLA
jgi:cytochrome c-type biogenesis protein